MSFFRPFSNVGVILVVGLFATGVAGCGGQSFSKFNPFKKDEKRLEGERVRVFPEGHKFGAEPEVLQRHREKTAADCQGDESKCPKEAEKR